MNDKDLEEMRKLISHSLDNLEMRSPLIRFFDFILKILRRGY